MRDWAVIFLMGVTILAVIYLLILAGLIVFLLVFGVEYRLEEIRIVSGILEMGILTVILG